MKDFGLIKFCVLDMKTDLSIVHIILGDNTLAVIPIALN